jgi:hypothetical protein
MVKITQADHTLDAGFMSPAILPQHRRFRDKDFYQGRMPSDTATAPSGNRAKRLECVELAPAFGRAAPIESTSKLAAL